MIDIEQQFDAMRYRISNSWQGEGSFDLSPKEFALILPDFHVIKATRRFQVEAERRDEANDIGTINDKNLKGALFNAYLSRDPRQKQRLAAVKQTLAEAPFRLGELDIARDPKTGQIDIGFVRPDGRLPIESLGSGSQQLLLMLGQVFLNDYPIIALEEPEMNLSPSYQGLLLHTLHRLMQDPAVKLNQLFISTHSPYLEFQDNFYDVTLDEQGNTKVCPALGEQHTSYFAMIPTGPDEGSRLNSLNQVELYDGVIQDLELKRGDLVLFVKNEESGRWEIWPAREVAQELRTISND